MVKLDDMDTEKVRLETCLPPVSECWVPWGDLWISRFRLWVVGNGCHRACPLAFRSVRGPGIRRSLVTARCCGLGPTKVGLFAPPFIFLSIFKHYSPLSCYHAWFCTLLHLNVHRCTLLRIDALIPPKMYKSAQWC